MFRGVYMSSSHIAQKHTYGHFLDCVLNIWAFLRLFFTYRHFLVSLHEGISYAPYCCNIFLSTGKTQSLAKYQYLAILNLDIDHCTSKQDNIVIKHHSNSSRECSNSNIMSLGSARFRYKHLRFCLTNEAQDRTLTC